MSEKRFWFVIDKGKLEYVQDNVTGEKITVTGLEDLLNEQQATIEQLKQRLYDFEKRKIIEESEIDEDVIPKIKLLRAELYGEKYD